MDFEQLLNSSAYGAMLCRFSRVSGGAAARPEVGVLVDESRILPAKNDDARRRSLTEFLHAEDPLAVVHSEFDSLLPSLTIGSEVRLLPPIEEQEIWGAGMTYQKQIDQTGSQLSLYDQTYVSDRPFLFRKGVSNAVIGPEGTVIMRADSDNTIAEPELTAFISPGGAVVGFSVGSDVTARDIEGTNPLYLAQAKSYRGSCAIGPGVRICRFDELQSSVISTSVRRKGEVAFAGNTRISQIVTPPRTLAEWLMKCGDLPQGAAVITGNGVTFPLDFTLEDGDLITHEIEGLGRLTTTLHRKI